MGVRGLMRDWAGRSHPSSESARYEIRLRRHDLARLAALEEMYPGRSRDEMVAELIHAALDEIEGSLPYIQGERIVAEDELGDPIYEDIGPSRRFYELTRKYL